MREAKPVLVTLTNPGEGPGGGGATGPIEIVGGDGEDPVSPANPLPVSLPAGPLSVSLGDVVAAEYETVAASQTNQVLGGPGAVGDYLSHLVISPAAAAAGAVSIRDGGGASIPIFAGGGTVALPTLAPVVVPLGMRSTAGAWQVTTGANVSVVAVGNFT